ncbi:MAG: endonuclease III domain-containing protein [Candidatus Altiarchaeota archaeon]
MDTTERRLLEVYDLLYSAYGPQRWWPADSAFEVCVGAILTQSTSWANVEKAIGNLNRENILSPEGLKTVRADKLSQLIRSSLYHNVKARKLKEFIRFVDEEFEGKLERLLALPLDELRTRLLSVWGIGPETADSIILYAAEKPSFVVDAYTKRVFGRLGFLKGGESYGEVKIFFEANLPKKTGLFNEYHALIVEHAKQKCKTKPDCLGCAVKSLCSYWK